MARWLKVALIVAAGLAFTAICTLLGTSSTLIDGMWTDPDAYSIILFRHIFLVMRSGMVISERLQRDTLGHIAAACRWVWPVTHYCAAECSAWLSGSSDQSRGNQSKPLSVVASRRGC